METTAMSTETFNFRLVCDDRCGLVRTLASVIRLWDSQKKFVFVRRDSNDIQAQKLINELDASPWSLLLFDDMNERWDGPESIPMILKNLPFGKMAAVFYILPGTMWLTRQLYMLVSRNKRHFVAAT
jgi:predicted DCC family thiol-disulfide oxidoreductase YuxK